MTLNRRNPFIYALGLVLAGTLSTNAQTAPADQAAQKPGMGMMAERQKMMAEMKVSQKKLDDLVAAMNAAKGADKVDRIAAVVTELATQHRQMGMRMMSMGGGMMMPMMQGAPGAAAPAAPAPKDGTAEDHAGHHPAP
jgi:hypothetical protein